MKRKRKSITLWTYQKNNKRIKKYCFLSVLGLAGMEVTCFIAAHMVLCFGFVATTVLWLLLSIVCTASRFHFSPLCPLQQVGQGWTRSWEGTQLGQLARIDQRDIPGHPPSCSATKTEGECEQRFASGRWRLPLHELFPLPFFSSLIKLSLSLPKSFLTSAVPILSLIPR